MEGNSEIRVFLAYQAGECYHYIVCNGVRHLPLLRIRDRQTLNMEWQLPHASKLAGTQLDKCDCLKENAIPVRIMEKIKDETGNL